MATWSDLATTADLVRRTLGVSPSAWEEAKSALGEEQACVVIACIMQKGTAINSAGAYLRKLTDLAKVGKFSLGPMLMALMPKLGAGEGGADRPPGGGPRVELVRGRPFCHG
ncbi:replication initiation protein RepC [Methylobacterium sp. E-016]|nr:replication initiation protein RepC [Methylobacterium sp. E-016]